MADFRMSVRDRVYAQWQTTHPMNNQRQVTASGTALPRNKLDCSVSHDASTTVNTIAGCR